MTLFEVRRRLETGWDNMELDGMSSTELNALLGVLREAEDVLRYAASGNGSITIAGRARRLIEAPQPEQPAAR